MNLYSNVKALYHQEQMRDLRAGRHPYPVHVEIILSDWCTDNCPWCSYRKEGYISNQLFGVDGNNNPKRMIPVAKVREILGDCRNMGVKAIQYTGGGEPTVHPDFAEIMKLTHEMGFDIGVITNGRVLHRREILDAMSLATWVRISVDDSDAVQYCRARGISGRSWDNLEYGVMELTNRSRGKDPVVGIGFLATEDNYRRMLDAVNIYKRWGADNVRLAVAYTPDGDCNDGSWEEMKSIAAYCEQCSGDGFTVINRIKGRIEELQAGSVDFDTCAFQHLVTYIGADLNVYRCCMWAYNERGLVGSLKKQTFRQFWDSEEKWEDYKGFDPHGCGHCQFSEVNEAVNAFLATPDHVNFV